MQECSPPSSPAPDGHQPHIINLPANTARHYHLLDRYIQCHRHACCMYSMDSSLSLSFDNSRETVRLGTNDSAAGNPAKQGQIPAQQLRVPAKKARSTSHNGNPPRCQVEGCGADLSSAKAYHLRHRVCGVHSKSPKVSVLGLEQRFCQQCSRFHELLEFDEGKRSCRRRLAGHNQRRRKHQRISTTLLRHPIQFATALPFYGQLGPMGTNGIRDHVIHVEGDLPRHMFNSNMYKLLPNFMQGHVTEVFPHGCLHELGRSSDDNFLGMLDSGCALSLLSMERKGAGPADEVLAGARPFAQSFQNLNLGLASDELFGVCLQSSNLPMEAHSASAPWN